MGKVYGLTGTKGSGKDFVGAEIAKAVPGTRLDNFAVTLRELLGTLTMRDYDFLCTTEGKGTVDKRYDMTYGQMMQKLGDAIRSIHPQAFVFTVDMRAEVSDDDMLVLTDVRMPNEHEFVKNLGGETIRIERVGGVDVTANDGRDAQHHTETDMDNVELPTLINDMTEKFPAIIHTIFSPTISITLFDHAAEGNTELPPWSRHRVYNLTHFRLFSGADFERGEIKDIDGKLEVFADFRCARKD